MTETQESGLENKSAEKTENTGKPEPTAGPDDANAGTAQGETGEDGPMQRPAVPATPAPDPAAPRERPELAEVHGLPEAMVAAALTWDGGGPPTRTSQPSARVSSQSSSWACGVAPAARGSGAWPTAARSVFREPSTPSQGARPTW